MLAGLFLHGALLVGLLTAYGRWLDDTLCSELCLIGLVFELGGALLLAHYVQDVDCALFCSLGCIESPVPLLTCALVLGFDELSGYFFGLLAFALVLCFVFLAEYFEYDAQASAIITLSALFSQTALLYFCAFDLILLLACWEGISFVSFFLVQHWASRLVTYKAGLKVFFISQLGDLPFFLFIFSLLGLFQTSEITELLPLLPGAAFDYVPLWPGSSTALLHLSTLLACCLTSAVLLKAAQWFFYPWLLDAMEAPVPISAQLHSSTLVVIGFYLFFRFQALYDVTPSVSRLLLFAGLFTAIGATGLAFYQIDGKRLLACSTAGQLGYVIASLGLGLRGEALALLFFCCANKALTFVWFGALMRRFNGMSDFRVLGGLSALTWLEHGGLAAAIASFTVFPGALGWHVKSLMQQGQSSQADALSLLSLELLQLTWACSALYLGYLYVALFVAKRAGSMARGGGRPGASPLLLARPIGGTAVSLALVGALLLLAWPHGA
jgi:NADH-quinone oxidoreductase subunit L